MHFKNIGARLITIATDDGKKSTEVKIIPGETKEVKGELGNAQDYVDYLVSSGQLVEVAGEKSAEVEPTGFTKAELQAALTEAGVDYPSTANKAELQAIYDANQS